MESDWLGLMQMTIKAHSGLGSPPPYRVHMEVHNPKNAQEVAEHDLHVHGAQRTQIGVLTSRCVGI